MTISSDVANDLAAGSGGAAPAAGADTSPFLWSVRREWWENRSIYLGPLIVTAFVLLGSVLGMLRLATKGDLPITPFRMAPAPIMLASFLVGLFYCLDALYGERRDRSILFWKSLPVSDRTTVMSKASIPLVVLPLIAFVLCVFTLLVLLLVSIPLLLANGGSPLELWSRLELFSSVVVMFYGLTVHALWFAPIYAWLMLVSAWARRAPFLWALLPVLALAAVERIAFNSWHLMSMLQYRVTGAMGRAFVLPGKRNQSFDGLDQLTPLRFLSTPGLWIGLVFAAACLAAAIRLRRDHEPG